MLIFLILSFLFCIFASGFFSGSEIAYVSLNEEYIEKLLSISQDKSNKFKSRIRSLLKEKDNILSTILLLNNIVNATCSTIGALLAIKVCLLFNFSTGLAVAISTICVSIIIFLFGELMPKILALKKIDSIIIRTNLFFLFLYRLFFPIIYTANLLVSKLRKMFPAKESDVNISVYDELRNVINIRHKQGRVIKSDRDMIDGLLELREVEVCEVMTPKDDVEFLDVSDIPSLIKQIVSSPRSRLPVYDEESAEKDYSDSILGILHVRDFFNLFQEKVTTLLTKEDFHDGFLEYIYCLQESSSLDKKDFILQFEHIKESFEKSKDAFSKADFEKFIKSLLIDNKKNLDLNDKYKLSEDKFLLFTDSIWNTAKRRNQTPLDEFNRLVRMIKLEEDLLKQISKKYPVKDSENELSQKNIKISDVGITKQDIKSILNNPVCVPESISLRKQLSQFKLNRNHLAIVVNEFGNMVGIVTLEDIIEEIVGDITDEHDKDDDDIVICENGLIIIDGDYKVRDFNRKFESSFSDKDATTIAGLIIDELSRIPEKNEEFTIDNYRFKILERNNSKISSIEINIKKEK